MIKYLPFNINDIQGWDTTDSSVQASIKLSDNTYSAFKYSERNIQRVDNTQVAMPFDMNFQPALNGLSQSQIDSLIEIQPDSTEWTLVDV